MFKNYFKIAWRNMAKNKVYSIINIAGLSVGVAVTMLIGLWMYDELSYNKSFQNYSHIAQVMQNQTFNGDVGTQTAVPYLMGEELRKSYGSDFKYVSMSSWTGDRILSYNEKAITKQGNYMEPCIIPMLSLKMVQGTQKALDDPHSIILSSSTANALFGKTDPMNKVIRLDTRFTVKVTGIYQDLPYNSNFGNLTFISSWKLFLDSATWSEKFTNPWRNNSFQTYVQIADNADMQKVSAKIKDSKLKQVTPADAAFKPVIFLLPMKKWHLYSQFKNGVNVGGRIQFVWLFGIIGFFVLLLACINFMNLSTARSEKRAKEVGIRKAIGSMRRQLISQFFSESLLYAFCAFALALILVQLTLPFFNELSDKKISILWSNPLFWLFGLIFILFTGIMAGCYPALYLSSFNPVKVLKGSFRAGPLAALPRKILVVLQFTISTILIIGTIIVFQQIQFAKNRPVGYSRDNLLSLYMYTDNIHKHFDVVENELKNTGTVSQIAESSSGLYYNNENDNGFTWDGKDASVQGNFNVVFVSTDFGKAIDWQLKEGRDFDKNFPSDTSAMVLNETAVKFMGIKNPVGKIITWDGNRFHIIGVVKDMVMQSPYQPVFRTVFVNSKDPQDVIDIKLNPTVSPHEALAKIAGVFKKYNPEQPFDYHFVDEEYAKKFDDEERIGRLAGIFAALAIFISCLGLFGMASFVAEQRVKEIGVRKVLGASVFNLWKLLSTDFVLLVIISFSISTPVAWWFMHKWLQNFDYRTNIALWVFAAAGIGALAITILTVSFQAIKAALANPVESLRTE